MKKQWKVLLFCMEGCTKYMLNPTPVALAFNATNPAVTDELLVKAGQMSRIE